MNSYILEYASEIIDFLNEDILAEIDYGVVDLSGIKNIELKNILYFYVDCLEMELDVNYHNNPTGIFRVHKSDNRYYYVESDCIIEADSIKCLKQLVEEDFRLWYVFDEISAKRLMEDDIN